MQVHFVKINSNLVVQLWYGKSSRFFQRSNILTALADLTIVYSTDQSCRWIGQNQNEEEFKKFP